MKLQNESMAREEAIEKLKDILAEATETDNSVCYVTSDDADALKAAIKALKQEPCDDAISREDAIKQCGFGMTSLLIANSLQRLPPVTPQPKIGRWIVDIDRWGDIDTAVDGYRCSECNEWNTDKDNYCPNCGAKMREVEE